MCISMLFVFSFSQGLPGSTGIKGEKGSALDVIGAKVSLCSTKYYNHYHVFVH